MEIDAPILLNFIKQKASIRKENVHKHAIFQTKDYLETLPMETNIRNSATINQSMIDDNVKKTQVRARERDALQAEFNEKEQESQKLTSQAKNETDGLKAHQDALANYVKQVTSKNIGNLNKILLKSSPPSLCEGLESLVALMRNHSHATPIDVELYFRDFNKIVLKMQRLDAAALDSEFIEKHQGDLQRIKPHFVDSTNSDFKKNNEFAPLIEWGCEFCVYARKVKNI